MSVLQLAMKIILYGGGILDFLQLDLFREYHTMNYQVLS